MTSRQQAVWDYMHEPHWKGGHQRYRTKVHALLDKMEAA